MAQDNNPNIRYNSVYNQLEKQKLSEREWRLAAETLFKNGKPDYGQSWQSYFRLNELLEYENNAQMLPTSIMARVEQVNVVLTRNNRQWFMLGALTLTLAASACYIFSPVAGILLLGLILPSLCMLWLGIDIDTTKKEVPPASTENSRKPSFGSSVLSWFAPKAPDHIQMQPLDSNSNLEFSEQPSIC